ncbi:MAG: FAD:protein FMN transferase [Balneolaceae bacterium]|nr:FAD:protein FMN transferase [Balneolaceae bacterium]
MFKIKHSQMYKRHFLITILCFLLLQSIAAQELQRFTFQSYHMGTQFNIVLYSDDDSIASQASEEAFNRIEELNQIMSDYEDDSELNRLSRTSGSGKAVKVSNDLFKVLKESVRMAELSDGLFDITVGPMSRFWRMVRMSPDPQLPTEQEIAEFERQVGYEHIRLDEENQTAELTKPDMQLDLGGIAKGYAAEEALKVLKSFGIERALVDAGGDVTLGDPPSGRESWDVAVPKSQQNGESQFITLQTANKTVTTSGDLFQFVEIDGTRYSHILNPMTGLGATNQIQATVIADEGMKADALSSILTLMTPEEGIDLINETDQTEAILFVNEGDTILEFYSNGAKDFIK